MAANTRSPHDVSWLRKIIDRFKTRRETESDGGNAGGGVRAARAEYLPKGRVAALDRPVEYKAYRIHTTPHLSGLWISMIVSIGTPKPVTKDSLTDTEGFRESIHLMPRPLRRPSGISTRRIRTSRSNATPPHRRGPTGGSRGRVRGEGLARGVWRGIRRGAARPGRSVPGLPLRRPTG